MIGIYKIKSRINPDRIYIGSAIDIKERWCVHRSNLKSKKHHSKKLQNHCNKYGIEDLVFEIIQECNKEELLTIEQSFLDLHDPWFNLCKIAGSPLGLKRGKFSDEHIKNLSISHIGKHSHLGIPHSKETKDKISKNHADMSGEKNPCYGKHPSETVRKKMTITHIGIQAGEKHPMFNKHHSEESKQKMRKSRNEYIKKNKPQQ